MSVLLSLLTVICVPVAAFVGVLLNIYVLRRLRRFAQAEPTRFENGCGLPLMAMAIADLLALAFFIPHMFILSILRLLQDFPVLQSGICKLLLYATHVTTNLSMWCWVLMSAMRYMAIYHPFLHLRVWLLPRRGVQLIVLLSLLLNVGFIGAVDAEKSKGMNPFTKCGETSLFGSTHELTWWLNLAEIVWGFFMPALLTLLMDCRVLTIEPPSAIVRRHVHFDLTLTRSLSDSFTKSERSYYNNETTRVPKPRLAVLKWLAITSMDLLLNAPDNILRFVIMFADPRAPVWSWYMPVRVIAQVCYFGQFGFNAIYLSLVVYKRSTHSKPSSGPATAMHSLVPLSSTSSQSSRPSSHQWRQRAASSDLPDLIQSTPTVSLLVDDCY